MDTNVQNSTTEMDHTSNATERAVAELWSEVLQIDQHPSADDNFFTLGGDSMSMVILEFRIAEEFAVKLPAGAVLGAPTLRDLCALIDEVQDSSVGPASSL